MATPSCWRAEGLALLLAVGCATGPEPRPAPTAPRRQVPIVFLENQPTRPFVELRVGQAVGYFLLDTGAAGHVMSEWFYQAAFPGQPLTGRRGFAVDFSGVKMPTTIISGVPALWGDGGLARLEFSVGPFSKPGEADGMAGIVSPQVLMDPGGALELDFPGRALRWWDGSPSRGVTYSLEAGTLQACRASTKGAVVYSWAMGVDGRPLWAMMDTGSPVTAVTPECDTGRALWQVSRPMPSGRGASRVPIETRAAQAVVDFGGVPWTGEVALMRLPLAECGTAALVGMNVLRRCSVVLSRERGTVLCSNVP